MSPSFSWITVILVGLAAGTISALLGIGSGIIIVPLLILLWGKSPHAAVATSLGLMIFLSVAGAARHHFSYHTVDWRMALELAVGGILGAFFIGAPISNVIKADTLSKVFGCLLIVVGLKMLGLWGYLARVLGLAPQAGN